MESTMPMSPVNVNCLEFEAGDLLKLKIPDSAMNEGFKTSMGLVAGISVGVAVIIFAAKTIQFLDDNIAPKNYYPQHVQQPIVYCYPPQYQYQQPVLQLPQY